MSQSFHMPWGLNKMISWGTLFASVYFKALYSIVNYFPFCLFPFIVNDVHIIGPFSNVSFVYDHFQTKFCVIHLFIQL